MQKKYKKPFLKEVIFEIKFTEDKFDSATPGQIFDNIKDEYPDKRDLKLMAITIRPGTTPKENQSQSPQPQLPTFQAWKKDQSALVQIGAKIVVANQLTYSGWENFTPVIQKILNAYIKIAQPTDVSRVAVRYINQFKIPESVINISDYFKLGGITPSELNQPLAFDLTFLHRINDFNVRIKFMTDVLMPNETGSNFILDIDCYRATPLPSKINQIMSVSEQAHEVISMVFENIITDKMRNLMEITDDRSYS